MGTLCNVGFPLSCSDSLLWGCNLGYCSNQNCDAKFQRKFMFIPDFDSPLCFLCSMFGTCTEVSILPDLRRSDADCSNQIVTCKNNNLAQHYGTFKKNSCKTFNQTQLLDKTLIKIIKRWYWIFLY